MTHQTTITALLITSALVTPAFAQDTTLAAEYIGTVVIGESRRGVQTETANSVTVIDSSEIEARQSSTFSGLLDTIPNVSLLNGNVPQGSGIAIRGLGSQAGLYGNDGKVAVVVDGVKNRSEISYRQGSLLVIDPELFKQVKVNRGPTGSYAFSGASVGGTIQATTKDGRDFVKSGKAFGVRQKFGFESNGKMQLSSTALAFAPDDRFDAILAYGRRKADNQVDGSGEVLLSTEFLQESLLAKLNFWASEDLRLTLGYSKSDIPQKDVPFNVYQADAVSTSSFPNVDRVTEDKTTYIAFNYDPIDNDLINLTARYELKDENVDLQSTEPGNRLNYLARPYDNQTKSLKVSNESSFNTGEIDHTLNFGFETGVKESHSLDGDGQNPGWQGGGKQKFSALYIINDMNFGNGLTITPALRFDNQTLTSYNNSAPYINYRTNTVTHPGIADGTEFKHQSTTGALSAHYMLDNGFGVFGSYAYNENLPTLNDMRSDTAIDTVEKAKTQEVGLSYAGEGVLNDGDTLKGKLTAYKTSVTGGKTHSISRGNLYTGYDLEGLELELSYVNPAFYADFNIGQNTGTATDTTNGTLIGEPFNYATGTSAQLTLGKRFLNDQLDLNFEVFHAAANDRTTVAAGATDALAPSKAYTLLTIGAEYSPQSGTLAGFEIRGAIQNLADTNYRQYGSTREGQGRNFLFSISKNF